MTPIKLAHENNARNRCLSPEEEAHLLDAVPAWMRPLITVALHTGMRLGELRALRWESVDERTCSIRIQRDKAGDGRWVAMNSVVQEALQRIKRERKILGPFVFCSLEGKYLHNFERYWRPAVTAAKIPNSVPRPPTHVRQPLGEDPWRRPLHGPADGWLEDPDDGAAVRLPASPITCARG